MRSNLYHLPEPTVGMTSAEYKRVLADHRAEVDRASALRRREIMSAVMSGVFWLVVLAIFWAVTVGWSSKRTARVCIADAAVCRELAGVAP